MGNGEKFNPIPLEQHVQGDPGLKGVLLIGNGRSQSALVVEPREPLDDEAGRAHLLRTLWARIEEANAQVPGQGRVRPGMVICALPEKPFSRTGKGTIVRRLTEEAYKDEIERLYSSSSQEARLVAVNLKPVTKTVYETPAVTSFLRQLIAISFPQESNIGENEDFFAYGLDSIQTLEITTNLKRNLQGLTQDSVTWTTPRIIYRYSSFASLSKILVAFLNDGVVPSEDSQTTQASAINDAVERYVKDLPSPPSFPAAVPQESSSKGTTVAIIGSTGYVGSHLVATLLKSPVVSQIYCLDRSSDASARLRASLDKIDTDLSLTQLIFFKVEIGASHLGLNHEQYI